MSSIQVKPYFILNTIASKRGGLTKAVVNRMKMFRNEFPEVDVQLLTISYQRNLQKDLREMRELGELPEDIDIRNFFYDIDPSKHQEIQIDDDAHMKEEKGFDRKPDEKRDYAYRYFINGKYIKYKRFNEEGKLMYIDYFNDSRRRFKREEYAVSGQLTRVIEYEPESRKETFHHHVGKNGETFLTIEVNDKKQWVRCKLHAPEPITFDSMADAYVYWIEQVIEDDKAPVLFAEFRDRLYNLPDKNLDYTVIQVKHPSVRKVTFSHSSHFAKPFTKYAPISAVWDTLYNHLNEFDKHIFLTNGQKESVAKLYGDRPSYTVIPHFVAEPDEKGIGEEYDKNKVILVARLHYKKRVEDGIKAFKKVVEYNPDAVLEIYGFSYKDKRENNINTLIEDLNLSNNIVMKGFTTDMGSVYKSSYLTIMTSRSEGFGMVMTESMSFGTPVIAYDINFGPRDIITHGENGYLVKDGDTDELGRRIIELMEDEDKRNQFSNQASSVVEKFSYNQFVRNWKKLLKELNDKDPVIRQEKPKFALPFTIKEVNFDQQRLVLKMEKLDLPMQEVQLYLRGRKSTWIQFYDIMETGGEALTEIPFEDLEQLDFIGDFSIRLAQGTFAKDIRLSYHDESHTVQKNNFNYRLYSTKHGNLSIKVTENQVKASPSKKEKHSVVNKVKQMIGKITGD
ncbi:glycosyltransferase [Thalassobacillus devorans]|uniref:glycosyltransferase n=1 Tax=Thalassobacillus devorans TaxID=279813 RepID=UPI00048EE5BE|nr:glycosyltransferase [Thalassobacillus devorans]